ncbi:MULTISPECIES: hypothetical protein [unclassified Snodgrassella]|uniref:hypothetical protein n=1 Tax=unclassified Snodgrassella TaxID=2625236 RepID=UPI0018DB925B|nr:MULTISPECIES: hypothetical protein [unclassified Snodgrassella]MBI0067306.1 hypothetical protein [Snodgrassella sp. M0110]MBI0076729.1 hypothetical protein [Snodgrassella sp. M0118]MBI0078607.1 hypothetical protein [Snodgrassella sp. M0112]
MKKILFLLLFPITCFAQGEISNFWEYGNDSRGISTVINDQVDSYVIYKDVIQDSDSSSPSYRRILSLKADGTFYSENSISCGYDCAYYSSGTFKKIDETHIQLQIKESGQSSWCLGGEITNTEPRDLGIFEIKTYEDRYDLIKINNK